MGYFLRYTNDAKQAKADLKRGYSFAGYMAFKTKREAIEAGGNNDNVVRTKHGWQISLGGLCAVAYEFDSIDDVIEFYNQSERKYGAATCAVIFEGTHVGFDDGGDGVTFSPSAIAKYL